MGISRETYYEWKKNRTGVSDAFKKAEIRCKLEKIRVIRKASRKQWTAAAWWLERRYNEEFSARTIQKHEGGVVLEYGELETGKKTIDAAKLAGEDVDLGEEWNQD